METIPVNDHRVPVTNLKLASALATMGVPLKKSDPVSKVYDDKNPRSTGGQMIFHFEAATADGLRTADLIKAFEDANADAQLDALIESLPQPHKSDLLKLLPLAIIAYARGILDNRERLLDLGKNAIGFVMVKKAQGFALINENASEKLKRKLLS